jgi:hypothetical protein
LEKALPKWRVDILNWLKGGIGGFDDEQPRATIADIPVPEIISWVEQDPEARSSLIAHAAPRTLDNEDGGELTRLLLCLYGQVDGVKDGIGAVFHSGGWTGPTSMYLKRQRDKFRKWLAMGFEFEVLQWLEREIEYLDRQIEREEIDEERTRFE